MAGYYHCDNRAWNLLQQRYEIPLLRFVERKRRAIFEAGKAENNREIVNRALFKAICTKDGHSARFDSSKAAFWFWIQGICDREVKNWMRQHRGKVEQPDDLDVTPEPILQDVRMKMRMTNECFEQLDPQLKELVQLKLRRGLSQKEIAASTGLSEPTVSRRINRALADIRTCLQTKGINNFSLP